MSTDKEMEKSMKKLLVAAAALMLLVPAVSSAQGVKMSQSHFNKAGKISLSGNLLSFDNIKSDEDGAPEPSNMGIAPMVGCMVMDNLQVNFGLAYSSSNDGAETETTTSMWMVAPGVRYYLDMLSKNNLFPSVGASYAMGGMTTETDGVSGDMDMSMIRVGAGITQAMGGAQGGHMTLNLDYAINTMSMEDMPDMKSGGLDVSVGFGLYF
jgi:hypothetical protein